LETETREPALVLAPEAPYPLAGGGALRTASLVHYLARTRPVDLIVFRQPGSPHPAKWLPVGLARQVTAIDLPAHNRRLPARAWRNAWRVTREVPPLVDRFAGFDREIERALEGRRYGVAVIEHFWCAPYCVQVSAVAGRSVLNLHNIESRLHEHCAAAGHGAEGFAHRIFRRAALELERRWLPRFSEVLIASETDALAALAIAPSARVTVYPNAIPWTPAPVRVGDHAIVFSGNLEYHPNVSAVCFFREQVWPALRYRWPGLVWRLVGKNCAAVRRYTSGDPRIEVRGEVLDAVAELARAKVAVAPILAGSGTRLKIIEAWAAGLPVVSTPLGAEGLPARDGENILLAGDACAFAGAVSRLLESADLRDKLGRNGRLSMETDFTWEAAWSRLSF
jgi:glycosyltransferase involved in cell wall biosynthesis